MQKSSPEPKVYNDMSRRVTNIVDPYRTATEFSKLIIKLRWIGCDEEASILAHRLAMVAPRDFAFVAPIDTD